jgi:hypothetical protein
MAIYSKICFKMKLSRKAGFCKNMPFLRPMSTCWAKKGYFSLSTPNGAKMPCYNLVLATNDHVLEQSGLFRAKKLLFWSYISFWASERNFMGLTTLLRPSRTFLGPKMAIYSKICFLAKKTAKKG